MGTVKYTGPVASFHCPTNAEIRSLKVHFSPKQLGEGDPSPENVRPIVGWDGVCVEQCRENLFHAASYTNTVNGITFTYYSNGDIHIEGTATANCFMNVPTSMYFTITPGIYTISGNIDNSNVNLYLVVSSANGGDIAFRTSSSTPTTKEITFTDNSARVQISVQNGKTVNVTIHPKLERGSYTANSITDYEFGVLGKNKFDGEWETGAISTSTGQNSSASDSIRTKNMIPVFPGEKYTISRSDTTSFYMLPFAYKKDGSFSRYLGAKSNTPILLSMNDDEYYLRFYLYQRTAPFEDCQLELGSTATTYEPYDPNHTVYGGWVDLISGEACEEWNAMYLKNLPGDWNYNSNNVRFQITLPSQSLNGPTGTWNNKNIMSEAYQTSISNGYGNKQIAQYSNRYIYIRDNDFEGDVEAFLSAVGDTKIVYKLPTATTYSLSPITMQTFLGQNNVWSNADYVEVEYDLHETQDILARKQFIIANQPHLEEVNNSMITFNTDLKAPLKECKIYFNPIQEGSGDPSPDNVRPIIGWTGLSLYHSEGNLYTPNSNNKGYISSSGVINVDTTSTYTDLIPVVVGDTYTFRCTTVSVNGKTNRRIHGYDSSGNWIKQLAVGTTSANIVEEKVITTTIPSGISYIRISFRNQDINVRVAREDAYDISWENEVGTVYGGYVDLVTGEVWETWGGVTLDGSQNAYISGSQYRGTNCTDIWFDAGSDKWGYNTSYAEMLADSYCDSLALMPKAIWGNPDLYPWAYVLNSVNQIHCVFDNSTVGITSEDTNAQAITKVKSWLASHPITVKYRLSDSKATFVVTLSPITLKALRGINNIWSNSNGNIELSYWTH